MKYRQLFVEKDPKATGGWGFNYIALQDGRRRSLSRDERQGAALTPPGGRLYMLDNLISQGRTDSGTAQFEFNGKTYHPGVRNHWKTTLEGMQHLAIAGRIEESTNQIRYVRFLDDFAVQPLSNLWVDTTQAGFVDEKVYVVQTLTEVIQRCLLMTTDPGDLILDPTCGSGTAAFMAEQWGRRWITIDTFRVALALARQRIMSAKYPYYCLLGDSPKRHAKEAGITGKAPLNGRTSGDIRKGFVYERVPHVTLKSVANNPAIKPGMSREEIGRAIAQHAETEILYDRPYDDKRKVRVAGRFTVESLSPHKTIAPVRPASEEAAGQDDPSAFERTILDNLLKAGVQNGRKKERLEFETLTPYPGHYLQAEGIRKNGAEGTPQRIAVSIGPQFGTVNPEWIRMAAREATHGQGFDLLLVCAFAFDPQAAKATEEFAPSNPGDFATVQDERRLGRVPILLVRMNSDLAMGDVLLKKTGSANLFMVFGEPDVKIERTAEGVVVEIRGVDVYNPTTGEIRSSGPGKIALWMIDTDYDGESFFVRHCYFTGDNDPYARLKKALKADIDEAAWASLYSTRSRPFEPPSTGKIAVKVINHYGDEVLQVYDV
jgi:adenine-specific DNA-methyltransferase